MLLYRKKEPLFLLIQDGFNQLKFCLYFLFYAFFSEKMTTETLADLGSIQPEESKYRSDVDEIKKRSNDVLKRIDDFERRNSELKAQMRLEEEKKEYAREIKRRKGKLTPRTYESYREEELDLQAQLSRLKRRNSKLTSEVEEMKKKLAESEAKEKELRDELDFTYQKRLLLDKRSAMLF